MKVIVFDMSMTKGVVVKGETDGKVVDRDYMKVNGELYNIACIIQDTSEAQCALDLVIKSRKAAEEAVSYTMLTGIRLLSFFRVNQA